MNRKWQQYIAACLFALNLVNSQDVIGLDAQSSLKQ